MPFDRYKHELQVGDWVEFRENWLDGRRINLYWGKITNVTPRVLTIQNAMSLGWFDEYLSSSQKRRDLIVSYVFRRKFVYLDENFGKNNFKVRRLTEMEVADIEQKMVLADL